ncbi:L-dopachrome tautomerase-related protein [Limibacter armeniacum]|uniref:L-dopachrome tautomerase-related protein n=1 Tax=Limibacter armeniacum TaxID=466084 RepID=UPI002FE52D13
MNWKKYIIPITIPILLISCQSKQDSTQAAKESEKLQEVASSEKQWTGIAISKSGRMFVNYPRWSENVPVSVAEIIDGEAIAYPDSLWNNYQDNNDSSFVCVQSVFVDKLDRLWVLDPANPMFRGVVERGPRLYQFDLNTDSLVRSYRFPSDIIPNDTYLNDIRIDEENNTAYITDSGTGGIITLNLKTGEANRRLSNHPSTKAETDRLTIGDITWMNSVNSDGIALSPDRKYLYYAALSGHTLYRVPTEALLTNTDQELGQQVEKVHEIHAPDGMLFGKNGNLYMASLETNAIYSFTNNGKYVELINSSDIKWADSFATDGNGNLYFTTSQIHLPVKDRTTYKIYKINPKKLLEHQ